MTAPSLPALAAAAIIVLIFVYVVLDGFDLGAGLLLPSAANRAERDRIVAAIAPTAYSSEAWLLCAALVAAFAFPGAFRVLAPALSIPIAVLLVALLARAAAIGLRQRADDPGERFWSWAFAGASLVAAGAQGVILGGYIKGTSVAGGRFVGSLLDWARPFSFLIAAALIAGYALMGAAWLVAATTGAPRDRAARQIRILAPVGAAAMAAISIATLLIHPSVSARWGISFDGIDWRDFAALAPLPALAGLCLISSFYFARAGKGIGAFASSVGVFAAGYAGLVVSVWPYIVPFGFTIENAAADDATLRGVLIAALCAAVPLMLISALAGRRARAAAG
jgi:cytochrome d ubiquinol oxidase subunit II